MRWVPRLVADPMRVGIAAEYDSPEAVVAAAEALYAEGYRRLDAYTPYPLEELDEKLHLRRTRVPVVTFVAGVLGALTGYLIQWYCNTVDYPLDVGGRPLHPVLSYLIITFETMVLFAGCATFVAFFVAGRLPEPWNPLFEIVGFDRVSADRFWLGLDRRDERFDPVSTGAHLAETGALRVVRLPAGEAGGGGSVRRAALLLAAAGALATLGGCGTRPPEGRTAWGLERMIHQPSDKPQEASDFFADGSAMRRPPDGTVPHDALLAPEEVLRGTRGGVPVGSIPVPVDLARLQRGRDRFEIYCGACHGVLGDGRTPVAAHMPLRPPPSLLDERIRGLPAGRLFQVVSEGYGLMPSYAEELSVADRWAVVAYLRALQLSQRVPLAELPPAERRRFRRAMAEKPRRVPPAAGGEEVR